MGREDTFSRFRFTYYVKQDKSRKKENHYAFYKLYSFLKSYFLKFSVSFSSAFMLAYPLLLHPIPLLQPYICFVALQLLCLFC